MRPKISLDHWQALISVVENGTYARASAELNKSQSTISYAVSKIEELLDVKVFNLVGRRAELTPAGQALFRQGQILVRQAEQLEERSASLAAGWESQLNLAVEMIFPPDMLLRALEAFSLAAPEPRVELYESVLGGTEELLQEHLVDLAVCSQVPNGFVGEFLLHVTLTAVAAPHHPLHQLNRELSLNDLGQYRQMIIRDSGSRRTVRAALEISEARWTVSHIATAISAVKMGLGFAWFPKESIAEQLASGEVIPLPMQQGSERWVPLYLAFADPEFAGPGARQLAKCLQDVTAKLSH